MAVAADLASAPREAVFRIGRWKLEPALNQLSAERTAVKLEPKATAVLCYLAERPGQVVSREALLSAAWPGVVVSDDALTQVVVKLRRALGDAPGEPTYIQTIPKGGYRLIAPMARSPDKPRRAGWLVAAAAGALLLAVAAAWWLQSMRGAETPRILAAPPSIAVLPLEAVGNDPQALLLARGIAADLVTDLSKMSGLQVVRASPGNRQAGARYLVSGTVQRAGERMRLHVHLADSESGSELWSERFDRALTDLFAIQDELGPKIVRILPVKVSEAERKRIARRYTRNLEAYEAFHRGLAALHVRRKAENETAREMFRRAIALDATFARAYAGLAMTYTADYRNQWAADSAAALERGFELARTAQQINPDTAEAYWVLAFVHSHRREHEQALKLLEAAVRLHPSFADAYALMGGIYTSIGRPAEGVALLRTAMRLVPESGYLYLMLLGRAYFALDDLEQAQLHLKQASLRNPEFVDARVYLAAVHAAAGDLDAAAWEVEEIRVLEPRFTVRGWLDTNPTADGALKEKLVRTLGAVGG